MPGYVPAIGERDPDKIIRGIRNLYELVGASERMTQNENFYVDAASGSDANDGLTSTRPWATGTHALSFLSKNVNLNGFVPTVNFLAGDQTAISHTGGFLGGSHIILSGPGGGTATFDGGIAIYENTGTPIWIQVNIRVENSSGGNGIEAGSGGSAVIVGDVEFGDITGLVGSGIYVTRGGVIVVSGLNLVDGDMPYFSQSSHGGHLRYDGSVLRYLQNCAFSQANIFSEGEGGDTVFTSGASFDTATHGATVTAKRYLVLNGASIQASGETETFIPGTIAGTSHNGGVYWTDTDSPVGVSGLRFPATQAPSSDANTLDDYEEGTWTPTITFATPGDLAVTYSTQAGTYTKVGRLVTVSISLVTSAFTHTTAAGDLIINTLPFTPANTSINYVALARVRGITKAGYTQFDFSTSNALGTSARIGSCGSGVAPANVAVADMPTGGTVVIRSTAQYEV